jgi:hypothetical protein
MCLDAELVPLIELLDARGLRTVESCVGGLGLWLSRAYVAFESPEDATTMIGLLLRASSGIDFHERLQGSILVPPTKRWEVQMSVYSDENPSFIATIVFPLDDLDLALSLLWRQYAPCERHQRLYRVVCRGNISRASARGTVVADYGVVAPEHSQRT